MLSNQDNTQMPGSMPGSMPGAIPENNNTSHNAMNQDAKSSIGGPHKIQSGILHHGLPVDNTENVHNNTHGEHNFSKDKSLVNNAASGMAGHQNNMNPLHSSYGESNIGNNNDHHYKRDAAALGTAGHELKNHHDQQFGFANHRAGNNAHQSGLGHNNHEGAINNPLHSEGGLGNHHASTDSPLHPASSKDNDHHYKRDAAMAGTAGAAGLAGHELKNHHDGQQFGFDNHRAGNNAHQSGLGHNNHEGINRSNPLHSEAGLGHTSAGNPLHPGATSSSNDNDHHYKRDAALGAGAAGLAGHELKNHHDNQAGVDNHHNGSNPLHSGSGLDNHHSATGNPLHPGSDNVNRSVDGNNDHHYKRDAALGAGAAGLAGHELKNHHDNQAGVDNHHNGSNPLHSGSGLDNHHSATGNPLHPGSDNVNRSVDGNNDHHYKRDAALGAGAAGLAGHELKNHHDNQAGVDNHHNGSNPLHSGSGLDNHHSATGNPLHPGSDNVNRSVDGNNDHHYKRDAALGAGAAGLAGHELKNHHDNQAGVDNHHNGSNPLHSGSGLDNHHSATGNPLHPGSDNVNRSVDGNNDHHYKRDAALGAGAAGLAGHELKNHHDNQAGVDNHHNGSNPLHSGSGLDNHHSATGNPLHPGSDNVNRSVDGNNDHHYKRDAALGAGAAGLAGHELKNHHDNQTGVDNHHNGSNPLHSGSGLDNHHSATGNPLHPGSDNANGSISGNNDHHYKRDAALGAGAAGLAGHELKNHHDKQSSVDGHHDNPLHPGSDNLSHTSGDNDHHYKRDAALGAAGAGVAAHEVKEHQDKREAASNRTSVSSAGSGEKKGAAVHDKPLNTGGDAHHIAEQPPMGLGGLTGKQPVGEVNFHKLS